MFTLVTSKNILPVVPLTLPQVGAAALFPHKDQNKDQVGLKISEEK